MGFIYCPNCGKQIADTAVACPGCGHQLRAQTVVVNNNYVNTDSQKSRLVALLLCLFLGGFGIHRFYVGKVGTGILWLLTAGVFGIGYLVDLIVIICGSFKDGNGRPVTNWN